MGGGSDRYQTFVAKLVRAREEAGLTQSQVAELISRSQRFVSYCETGERRVDAVEFLDFCRAYNKPPSWFIRGWPG
ncbi:MAG: helix-turn-helix transcriptional regulator [Planctomycetes bacterium]|nr:helix-turn-helix transcriptional regulator [Planctomycetota bacterium]